MAKPLNIRTYLQALVQPTEKRFTIRIKSHATHSCGLHLYIIDEYKTLANHKDDTTLIQDSKATVKTLYEEDRTKKMVKIKQLHKRTITSGPEEPISSNVSRSQNFTVLSAEPVNRTRESEEL